MIKKYDYFFFGIIGLLTAIINFAVLFLLYSVFNFNYLFSVTTGYIFGVCFNFFSNKFYTFNSKGNLSTQIMKYLFLLLVNYFITIFIIFIAHKILKLNIYFALASSMFFTYLNGYFFSKLWIFNK